MGSEVASVILGVILVIAGIILVKLYYKKQDEEILLAKDKPMHPHIVSMLRRRYQIAVIFLFLGVLIPVCDIFVTEKRPTYYVVCMSGVLLLSLWVLFLGTLDFMMVRVRVKGNLQVLNTRRKELEHQILEMKKQQDYKNDPSSDIHDVNLN